MAGVTYDLEEGLTYTENERTTVPMYTLVAHVYDLEEGSDQQLIAQAMGIVPPLYTDGSLYGIIPTYGAGSTVLLKRTFRPFAPVDCFVSMYFGSPISGTLLGPVKLDISVSLTQAETQFDAANQALPWNMRTAISVQYDASSPGAPGSPIFNPPLIQVWPPIAGGTVPYYAQYPTATFTTTLPLADFNVGALGTQYAGTTNSSTYMGEPPNSLLCMGINGSSDDGMITDVTQFHVQRDIYDLWTPVLRYIDPVSGLPPKLTQTQIAAYNGVNQIVVQGQEDFNSLPF
jgi:hypothetical protein